MKLNRGQSKIAEAAVDWFYNSSEQVFEIDGLAGTGKSVLIFEILKRLNLNAEQFMPMAYTGQASIVMRTKGFPNARSIHSSLYEMVLEDVEDERTLKAFGIKRKKKKVFRKRKFIDPNVRLFFIDEAYMVPDYMERDILSFGVKVIVCGDQHQLPPVKAQPAFLTGKRPVHHLTELMRQSAGDPIIYLANRIINNQPIHRGTYGNVLVIGDDEFTPQMIPYASVIICGTNRTRDTMNNYVRHLYGFNSQLPNYGERVICRNNKWDIVEQNIALANGLSGVVVNSPMNLDPKDKTIYHMDFLPDLLNTPFENLDIDFKYFTSNYEARTAMRNDPMYEKYSRGLMFEYSYALTTHLSQGSEYPTGIYIEEMMRPQMMMQLNYTAVTRFVHGLIYVVKTQKYFNIPYEG